MATLADSRRVESWFELVSVGYDSVTGPTFWPRSVQETAVAAVRPAGKRVLDIGCGTGRTAEHLAETGAVVYGIDRSRPQLEQARGRRGDAGAVVRGDAERLPYGDASFDAVVSVGALQYFPDAERALAEARRVTKPGGEACVVGFNAPAGLPRTPVAAWARLANAALFETYDAESAAALFRSAGWTDVRSRVTGPAWHPRLALVTAARRPS